MAESEQLQQRCRRLREQLREQGLDALLITQPANRRYVSGFDGSSGLILVGREEAFLITDSRYLEQARAQSPHLQLLSWQGGNLAELLSPLLEKYDCRKLAFEEKHLTYQLYRELESGLAAELLPCGDLVGAMRMIKDSRELDCLRRGALLLDRAFRHITAFLAPGLTEKEVALELECFLRQNGAERASFSYIVASGSRGAMPHGVASDKALGKGELITMDFGAFFEGYATDITRTVALGPPDTRQRELYEIVRQVQETAREGLRAGMPCSQADALARAAFKDAGCADYFGHGLGHGIGLEVHERPALSPRGDDILQAGMVVTVEPGLYLPGWGGIRIEDMLLVGETTAESLTASPRELIAI